MSKVQKAIQELEKKATESLLEGEALNLRMKEEIMEFDGVMWAHYDEHQCKKEMLEWMNWMLTQGCKWGRWEAHEWLSWIEWMQAEGWIGKDISLEDWQRWLNQPCLGKASPSQGSDWGFLGVRWIEEGKKEFLEASVNWMKTNEEYWREIKNDVELRWLAKSFCVNNGIEIRSWLKTEGCKRMLNEELIYEVNDLLRKKRAELKRELKESGESLRMRVQAWRELKGEWKKELKKMGKRQGGQNRWEDWIHTLEFDRTCAIKLERGFERMNEKERQEHGTIWLKRAVVGRQVWAIKRGIEWGVQWGWRIPRKLWVEMWCEMERSGVSGEQKTLELLRTLSDEDSWSLKDWTMRVYWLSKSSREGESVQNLEAFWKELWEEKRGVIRENEELSIQEKEKKFEWLHVLKTGSPTMKKLLSQWLEWVAKDEVLGPQCKKIWTKQEVKNFLEEGTREWWSEDRDRFKAWEEEAIFKNAIQEQKHVVQEAFIQESRIKRI